VMLRHEPASERGPRGAVPVEPPVTTSPAARAACSSSTEPCGSSEGRSASTPASPCALSRPKCCASRGRVRHTAQPPAAPISAMASTTSNPRLGTKPGPPPPMNLAKASEMDPALPPHQSARQVQPPDGGALRLRRHVADRDRHTDGPQPLDHRAHALAPRQGRRAASPRCPYRRPENRTQQMQLSPVQLGGDLDGRDTPGPPAVAAAARAARCRRPCRGRRARSSPGRPAGGDRERRRCERPVGTGRVDVQVEVHRAPIFAEPKLRSRESRTRS